MTTILEDAPATIVIEDEVVATTDDPSKATHYVMVPGHLRSRFETPHAYVLHCRIFGLPVTAYCGYTWIPQNDPEKFPHCAACKEKYETVGSDLDERKGNLPKA